MDALVLVLVAEFVYVLIDKLGLVLVQVLCYVLSEPLVCVPVEQHFHVK